MTMAATKQKLLNWLNTLKLKSSAIHFSSASSDVNHASRLSDDMDDLMQNTKDEGHEDQSLLPTKTANNTLLHDLFVFSIMFFMLLANCGALLSSQISGLEANIFQLNSLRFALQLVVIIPLIVYNNYSLRISVQCIHLLIGYIICNLIFGFCFYFAASFMPVGNLHNLFVACFILISTAYDFCSKNASWKTVLIACTAIGGIILLAQPWDNEGTNDSISITPCKYLDSTSHKSINISDRWSNRTEWRSEQLKHDIGFQYVLIVLCAVANTVGCNLLRKLVLQYNNLTVMFWSALFEGVVSFVINMIWTAVTHGSYYGFPSGTFCLIFSLCFILFGALVNGLTFYTFEYVTISTDAINNAFVAIVLYISQRTYLKAFHPGHANATEVIGVVVIIFAAAVLQFLFLILDRLKKS